MSALENLLTYVKNSKGIEHISAIRSLRDYINATKETELISAIRAIKDITLMKYIIEAGVPAEIQRVTMLHYDRLKAEGGE